MASSLGGCLRTFYAPGCVDEFCAATSLRLRQPDANALKNAAQSKEWLTYGGNYAETRYSPLRQIDASNVDRLGLAWTYVVGRGGGNQEATPLFSNGVLYGITNYSIAFALDAKTGKELWRFDPERRSSVRDRTDKRWRLLRHPQSGTRTLRRQSHRTCP